MFGLMRNLYLHMKKKRGPRTYTLIFLGLDNAGKTTCLAALKGEPTEDATQSWGFNSEKLQVSKFSIEVYDLGGGKSIRKMWENYYAEAHGFIFVVDASDEERMAEAKTALQKALSHAYVRGKPLLVCANKQDLDKAVTSNDLTDYLDLDSCKCNHLCIECIARGPENSIPSKDFIEGVEWLLNTASVQYTSLQDRINKDVLIEKEKQEKKMEERRQRVEKMKALRQQQQEKEEEQQNQQDEQSEKEKEPAGGGGEKEAGSPISPKAGVYAVDDEEPQLAQEDSCAAQVLLEGNEKDKQMDSQEVELPGVIATA